MEKQTGNIIAFTLIGAAAVGVLYLMFSKKKPVIASTTETKQDTPAVATGYDWKKATGADLLAHQQNAIVWLKKNNKYTDYASRMLTMDHPTAWYQADTVSYAISVGMPAPTGKEAMPAF